MSTLQDYQKRHIELRQDHLESLAEAQVVTKNPILQDNPDKFKKATEKEIRRILRNEQISRSHKSICRVLKPQIAQSKIDIPSTSTKGHLADPKTWSGPWETINDPAKTASEICKANSSQYHQANNTPFACEPLRSYFGLNSNGRSGCRSGILIPARQNCV